MKRRLIFAFLILTLLLGACQVKAKVAETVAPEKEFYSGGAVEVEEVVAVEATEEASYAAEMPQPLPTQSSNYADDAEMTFTDYGVNPPVDAQRDNLSTFAIDVDTGAYTIARNYIYDGILPPYEAVRAEEFINYFRQNYPMPAKADVFSLNIDGAPSPFAGEEDTHYLRFGIQGYDVSTQERAPLSLTMVIDVSGSMADRDKMFLVKDSVRLLVDRLRRDDWVSVVAYTTDAWVALEPTSGAQKKTIMAAVDALYPMASTNVEAGLLLGYDQANRMFNRDGINKVILLSDGVANVGNTSTDAILRNVGDWARRDITLTAIGFGMGVYNDTLMEQLANNGDGFYAYVDVYEEAERLFVDQLTSTLVTIALNAKIQVEFNPDVVETYRLIGYENRAVADDDFRNNEVDAGEVGAGHSVTAVYAVTLNPRAEGWLAALQLRWEDPESHRVFETSETMRTCDVARSFYDAGDYYQLAILVARWAEILDENPYTRTTLRELDSLVQELPRGLFEDDDVEEFVQLVELSTRCD